jgi:hypothetical protein
MSSRKHCPRDSATKLLRCPCTEERRDKDIVPTLSTALEAVTRIDAALDISCEINGPSPEQRMPTRRYNQQWSTRIAGWTTAAVNLSRRENRRASAGRTSFGNYRTFPLAVIGELKGAASRLPKLQDPSI